MKQDVKVPAVGESISEVTIAHWLKKDGDIVEADDLICEIESDKASFEIPAESGGVLKILAGEGDTIEIGAKIAEIDTDGATGNNKPAPESKETAESKPAQSSEQSSQKPESELASTESFTVVVPTVGESISEVTIAQWLKPDGAQIEVDDLICEIESDKASFEIPAEASGTLKHLVNEGDTVEIGAAIAEIGGSGSKSSDARPAQKAPESTAESSNGATGDDRKVKISPVAANMLNEAGISPQTVTGSGPGGKITKEDAKKALDKPQQPAAQPEAKPQPSAAKSTESVEKSGDSGDRGERRERMSTLRRTISKRLVASKNETAMLTTFNEADMSAIMDIRKKYKEVFKEKHEIGLGFMSFFSKAVCLALRDWPSVNAMIDGDHIIYHDFVDISIAVSTPRGLVVPVIRNAESMSLADIEREVVKLATRARDNKLTIEEMTGGTFTITNGGVFGSLMSTPIINIPQSAILGMHKIQERPMVIDGQIVARPMMYLALSYDHRIIDGRESVSFLVRVKELLEDPARMLLEI